MLPKLYKGVKALEKKNKCYFNCPIYCSLVQSLGRAHGRFHVE